MVSDDTLVLDRNSYDVMFEPLKGWDLSTASFNAFAVSGTTVSSRS